MQDRTSEKQSTRPEDGRQRGCFTGFCAVNIVSCEFSPTAWEERQYCEFSMRNRAHSSHVFEM